MKKVYLAIILGITALLSACSFSDDPKTELHSPAPETEIISEPPYMIGHIVELVEDKQIIGVIENSTKQGALDYIENESEDSVFYYFSNIRKIEGVFKVGDKVAVWESSEGPEIAKFIVVLEN